MPCLVQQLFRLKIGKELDPSIVDEVLFPLLFRQKYLPYSLHLDIRMVQNITIYPLIMDYIAPANRPQMVPGKVPPFASTSLHPAYTRRLRRYGQENRLREGRHGSKFRRKNTHKRNWGSVDILNELRSLKYPQMGYLKHTDQGNQQEEECDLFSDIDDEYENAFLLLEEDDTIPDISGYWRKEKEKSLRLRSKFVNGFLDSLIKKGDHPSWGGNPRCEFQPVLVGERERVV